MFYQLDSDDDEVCDTQPVTKRPKLMNQQLSKIIKFLMISKIKKYLLTLLHCKIKPLYICIQIFSFQFKNNGSFKGQTNFEIY